jgi:hypothetical protein
MKNLRTLTFLLLCLTFCVTANAFTVAPSGAKSDTIKPKRPPIRTPGVVNPSQNMDRTNDRNVKHVPQKDMQMEDAKPVERTTEKQPQAEPPKKANDTNDPKAAEKAAAEAKKAADKKVKEDKEKLEPPKFHTFAWLSLGLGILAVAGLIGYFIMPILGLLTVGAILAGIFGYLAVQKIKKEPLKWKGLPFTTFGGMSILALLTLAVVWLISFFRTNSGI